MSRWDYIKKIIPSIKAKKQIQKRLTGRYADELDWGRGSEVDFHDSLAGWYTTDPWLSERDIDELYLELIDEHIMNPKNFLKNILGKPTYESMPGKPSYDFVDLPELKRLTDELEYIDINYKTPFEQHKTKFPPSEDDIPF